MARSQRPDKFRNPEIFFNELMSDYVHGAFHTNDQNVPVIYRAAVIAVDVKGGMLQNPDGQGSVKHEFDGKEIEVPATIGPKNPRNSVKARVLSDGFDQMVPDDDLMVFWPFFPEHASLPVKPGEHVYVIFEDPDFLHGLWVTKVAGHDNFNFFRGKEAYEKEKELKDSFPDSKGSKDDVTDRVAGEALASNGYLAKLFGEG